MIQKMKGIKMIRIKDIANVCHVSIATVSKALNDSNDISDKRKREICQKAKELGYYPNVTAKALKTKHSYNIGVIFMDEQNSGLTHPYFSYVLESLKETIEEYGYDMTFINSYCKTELRMSYYERCKYRGVDGVVIACINFDNSEIKELVKKDIPIVTIDHVYHQTAAIMSDNAKCMMELMQKIIDKGHRQIAYIHGKDSSVTKERLSAYYKVLSKNRIQVVPEYVIESGYQDIELATIKTKELLKMKNPPTCILYPDDYSCIGGINATKQLGKRIPEDISIVGYDGIPMGSVLDPKLTTVDQVASEVGNKAGLKIIDLIEKPLSTLQEIQVVKGKVVITESVKDLTMK